MDALDKQGGPGVWVGMAYPVQELVSQELMTSKPITSLAGRVSPIVQPATDFEAFYRLEFASMVALARAICGDHQQAEDLAQEAMSRAHRHWTKVSNYDRPGAWLRRVTINLALSRRRKFQRELVMLRRSAAVQQLQRQHVERAQSTELVGAGLYDEVWQAVRQLPPKQRAAIALFYQEDLSTSDIADALGCTVSTATSHLSQARSRLAALLDEPLEDER